MPDNKFTQFNQEEIEAFRPAMKIGLLASVNPEGQPHITLFSSLMAAGDQQLCIGKFVEGISFDFFQSNPKVGWMIMSLDKELWCGKASFTHLERSGNEFDFYNNVPMFRYNAYFGIHTVYYFDLLTKSGKVPLPMNKVIGAAIKTMVSKPFFRGGKGEPVMNHWTCKLFNKLDTLKFLSYIDQDGHPVIIPVIQAQSANDRHLIFALGAFTDEIKGIPEGVSMAMFGMSLDMTDVLVRGTYQGLKNVGLFKCGVLEVDYVYNPMPPVPAQIYPPKPLEAITEF
jgi:hypothetical protein